MIDALISGVVIVVGGGLIGGFTQLVVVRRRGRSLARDGRLECTIRVVEGVVPGVKPGRWQHGTATLDAGTMEFRRGLPGGRGRRPGSSAVYLREVTVGTGRRSAKGRELLSTMGTVLDLRTPTATLEWVVEPARADWAVQQVAPLT